MKQPRVYIDLLKVAAEEGTNWMTLAAADKEQARRKAHAKEFYLRNRERLLKRKQDA